MISYHPVCIFLQPPDRPVIGIVLFGVHLIFAAEIAKLHVAYPTAHMGAPTRFVNIYLKKKKRLEKNLIHLYQMGV